MIKHISFDLWLTLIKSHPEFNERRAEYLKKEFNPRGYSVKEIIEIIRNTDKSSDRLNEISGKKVRTEWMYRRILLKLGNDQKSLGDDILKTIKFKVNDLFMKFQPQLLNSSIQPMLYYLKNEGYDLSISSNTGFIEGNIIADTFHNLNLNGYFKFCIFSDEIGVSKPSYEFFDKVFEKIDLEKGEVLHIGDNFKADYTGALNYGFKALHINKQQYTIYDIKRHL